MIEFEARGVDLPELNYEKVKKWLTEVACRHDRRIGNLHYLFCDDDEILKVNRKFLNHDYFTDIITFDYSNRGRVAGDMVISVDTVNSNASEMCVDPTRELLRVIVHGLLHLCGINDKGPGEREFMELNENEALSLFVF